MVEITRDMAAGAIVRVGVDLAKRVIQVHAVDGHERVVCRRSLPREKFLVWCAQLPAGCMVVMEVSSSAHHWARALQALGLDARIVAAQLAAPYRSEGAHGKNDANDAAAICEAAGRPHMRFIPVKSVEQQSMLSVHRLREGIKADRTACINRIRGLLLEFGVAVANGTQALRRALGEILEDAANEMNWLARVTLQRAQAQWNELDEHLAWCDQRIAEHGRANAEVRRAGELMGVGPVSASAAVATVGDFKQFRSGAQFGAWLGLAPRQHSSGGKSNLGSITKRGDTYLRTMLIQGAKSVVNNASRRNDPLSRWVHSVEQRRGWQVAVVALANKNARILWAVMTRGERFDVHHVSIKPN